jgi:hypothetical protein
MPQGSKRKWLLRIGVLILVCAVVAYWVGFDSSYLKIQYAAYQLNSATTDEERTQAANQLVSLGTPGLTKLIEIIQSGNDPCRNAAAIALNNHLGSMPEGDRRSVPLSGQIIEACSKSDDAARKAFLGLMSNILKQTGNTYAARCREAISAGLKTSNTDTRLLAIRLAMHPDVKMSSELLPLMADPDPHIRGAALFCVATANDGDQAIAEEDLFRWLHDADEGVRKVCRDALVNRGRTEMEITLARRLSNPDALERLKLLYDLRNEDEVIDPEPWLERLSRDREPALRAGATRVILEVLAERKSTCPAWVARVSDSDSDPTVRRVAAYFRKTYLQPPGEVRPVGGP